MAPLSPESSSLAWEQEGPYLRPGQVGHSRPPPGTRGGGGQGSMSPLSPSLPQATTKHTKPMCLPCVSGLHVPVLVRREVNKSHLVVLPCEGLPHSPHPQLPFTRSHMLTRAYTHTRAHTRLHSHTCSHALTLTHMLTCAYTHICSHAHTHGHTHGHMLTLTHMLTLVHTHEHRNVQISHYLPGAQTFP